MFTPINISVAQKKQTNNGNIIGGAKAQPATLLRGPCLLTESEIFTVKYQTEVLSCYRSVNTARPYRGLLFYRKDRAVEVNKHFIRPIWHFEFYVKKFV